jgi:hypothetical protein
MKRPNKIVAGTGNENAEFRSDVIKNAEMLLTKVN